MLLRVFSTPYVNRQTHENVDNTPREERQARGSTLYIKMGEWGEGLMDGGNGLPCLSRVGGGAGEILRSRILTVETDHKGAYRNYEKTGTDYFQLRKKG